MYSANNPLVSIIIPCYNNASFVKEAIESALNQTYPHIEVIVIDDGSTDNSLDIIRSFSKSVIVETGNNRGAQLARNRGIELAKGEFIKFLDADDMLLPDCIERQVAQANQLSNTKKAIVYSDAIWVDVDGKTIHGYSLQPRYANQDPIAHILQNSPLTSCPLHRRKYLQVINGFDPSLWYPKGGDENYLHLRLVLSGVEFIYYPGEVYKYRQYTVGSRMTSHLCSSKGSFALFEDLKQQQQLIELHIGELAPDVKIAFALQFWAYGRCILREGYKKEAERYFETARELSPRSRSCINGKPPYPLLVKLIGAIHAEYLLDIIKSIFKILP